MPKQQQRATGRAKWSRSGGVKRKTVSIAEHHRPGLQEVKAALQREFERRGDHHTPRDGTDLSWRDLVDVPATPGARLQRHFTGRLAAIIDAVVRVEHTYAILTGPLPALIEKLKDVRTAAQDVWSFASDSGAEITALIHNADITRGSNMAFGEEPREATEFDFDRANEGLLSCIDTADNLGAVITLLEARMPDVVAAGFYGINCTGPVGHFAMILSEHGLSNAEIAEILGRTPTQTELEFPERWKDLREVANDGTKHLVNRAKLKLSQAHRAGTNGASSNVPPRAIECVITQLNVGADQHISGYFAGPLRQSVPDDAASVGHAAPKRQRSQRSRRAAG